jgi:hypothetical protein
LRRADHVGRGAAPLSKDLRLADSTVHSVSATTELADEAARIHLAYIGGGEAERDFFGVIRCIRGRSGARLVNQILRCDVQLKMQRIVHPCK